MPEGLKKFLKVYPLPTFVLVLTFVVYYFAFEILNKQESKQKIAVTEEESMLRDDEGSTQLEIAIQDSLRTEQPVEIPSKTSDTQTPTTETTQNIESPEKQEEIAQLETINPAPQQLPIEIATPKYVTTNSPSLNIRKEPSTTASIVGKLTPQQTMILLEEQAEWVFVADSKTQEPIGYVFKQFAKILDSTEKPTIAQSTATQSNQNTPNISTENTEEIFTSRVPSLNIREYPSTDAPIVGKLTPRDSVLIVEEDTTWVKIQDTNSTAKNGWVVRRSLVLRKGS